MRFRSFIGISVIGTATAICVGALAQQSQAPVYPLMSWPEYLTRAAQVAAHLPYIVKIDTPHGGLCYFGARHSDRPADPQVAQIEKLWNACAPEIALVEGGVRSVARTKSQTIRHDGEAGLVGYLAARRKIDVESIDPTPAAEIAALRKTFPAEQLKMFYMLRYIPTYRLMPKPDSTLEKFLEGNMAAYSGYGLANPPNSIAELDSMFAGYFPGKGSYKDPDECQTNPACLPGTFLNEISRASSAYRDQFMLSQISRLACQKRVFAVVGWSHIVVQEAAIRKLLPDQCGRQG